MENLKTFYSYPNSLRVLVWKRFKKSFFFSLFPKAVSTVLHFLDSAYGPWAEENFDSGDKAKRGWFNAYLISPALAQEGTSALGCSSSSPKSKACAKLPTLILSEWDTLIYCLNFNLPEAENKESHHWFRADI